MADNENTRSPAGSEPMSPAELASRVARGERWELASAPAAAPLPLTDERLEAVLFHVLRHENDDKLWKALTYDSGPYEVTKMRPIVGKLMAAIERECRGTPAAGEPSGEYMGLPFAEARRRILEMPQDIAQGLAISLLIQNGTLNRALAAVSEPQAGQEVDVSDTSAGGKAE